MLTHPFYGNPATWRPPKRPVVGVCERHGSCAHLCAGLPELQRHNRHVLPGQRLFAAYLHAAPGYRAPRGSVFAGLELEDPVQVRDMVLTLRVLVASSVRLKSP